MKPEKATIQYGEKQFSFEIVRSERLSKQIKIQVEHPGKVLVKAPPKLPVEKISELVRKRARWIIKRLDLMKAYSAEVLPRQYVSGETHFYLGNRYVLKVIEAKTSEVRLSGSQIRVYTKDRGREKVKELLSKWYRQEAEDYLSRRLKVFADVLPWVKEIPPWRLLKTKKQWGSCSAKGAIILNPALVKAPRECIDYVIIHELCHLREHNHSQRFYKLLSLFLPDWKARKSKLDGMAELLLAE